MRFEAADRGDKKRFAYPHKYLRHTRPDYVLRSCSKTFVRFSYRWNKFRCYNPRLAQSAQKSYVVKYVICYCFFLRDVTLSRVANIIIKKKLVFSPLDSFGAVPLFRPTFGNSQRFITA